MAGLEAERVRASLRSKLFGDAPRPLTIGRFEVLSKVADGGMGVVYRARDPALERIVALKLLHPGGESAQLLKEARAMARLDHPNVVGVFEVGTSGQEERVFIAMEYVEGTTLDGWLRARPRSATEIAAAFASAARGLAAAHRVGLVHRDFKPQNVLVSTDGQLRVADFGLARAAVAEAGGPLSRAAPLSRPQLAGTPLYMAPELFTGASPDPRSDQFSFSVALFDALFGAKPFCATTLDELRAAHARGPIVRTGRRDLPRWLRAAVTRGLAREPAQRFASMDAFADALVPGTDRRSWMYGGALLAAGAAAFVYAAPWKSAPLPPPSTKTAAPSGSTPASGTPSAASSTTELPPPPSVDWKTRKVPAYSLASMRERLTRAGYTVRREEDGTTPGFKLLYTTVSKPPCSGGVTYSEYPDDKLADHSEAALSAYGGSRVVRSGNRILQITLSRVASPEGDAACTDPLAVLMTD